MELASSKEAQWLLKEKYQGAETAGFFEDLKRIEAGEPLAYVIGWMPFMGLKVYLDSHPLIPRPETEYWVEGVIEEIHDEAGADILDLCAGSGAIGLAMLQYLPASHVDFIEIDRAHHGTILKNLYENRIDQTRAKIMGGDLFEKAQGPYNYIFSNPPYIDPEKKDRVQESVQFHEPALALYGGEGGLELILRIIREAPKYLKDGGALYIEHEPEQLEAIVRYGKDGAYQSCESLKDQYGRMRLTRFVKA